jgi:hypothetical protein
MILTGCAAVPPAPAAAPSLPATQINQAEPTAFAEKVESPARGTRTCRVKQYTSHFRKREGLGLGDTALGVQVIVQKGQSYIGLAEDIYPGSTVYFLIDGHRYSGRAGRGIPLDSTGLAALKKDPVIDVSWRNWPYGHEANSKEVLEGFSKAYADCLSFLK